MPGLAETAELAVRITLQGNASAGLAGLQKQVNGLGTSLGRVGKGVGQVGAGLTRAGVRIGAVVASGLGLAAKAAIDFEDAFAGVRKTVEGTPEQLDAVYGGLRKLATRIPIKFTDLAGIAQEAGALGVARQDVVGFTDVVARLSAATVGLTTDAAAEAFGKLGNVLFTTQEKADGLIDEYNRMGSALVALGNAGASSEGDIIEVAKRFGAAGHAAGLTAAQVLGLSSAVASLGVEPEAAGGALSRLFNNLTTNLALGNKKAIGFGKTLGLTAKQAKEAFRKDALGTFETFLKKLAGLDKFAQAKALKAAGITNSRDINAIRLMSQQYAEVARQVDLSTEAYDKNTDLAEVSAKRFDTLKNKLIELKNLFFDSAVTVASGFTPALGRAADKIRDLISQPGTQATLVSIGKDIGDAIDKINWQQVIDGAKKLVDLFKGALDVALEIARALDKLPAAVKEAGLGFLAIDKLSGGLVGQGVGNIVGGLGGAAAKGLASKLPGVGSLFAQPVFVTNWPLGGLGGVGGAAGAAGGLSAISKVFLVGEAIGLGKAVLDVANSVKDGATQQAQDIHSTLTDALSKPNTLPELQTKLAAIDTGIERLPHDPLGGWVTSGALAELQGMRADVVSAIDVIQHPPNQNLFHDQRDPNVAKDRAKEDRTQVGLDRVRDAIESDRIQTVTAIHKIPSPKVSVHVTTNTRVNVTANTLKRAVGVTNSYSAGMVGAMRGAG